VRCQEAAFHLRQLMAGTGQSGVQVGRRKPVIQGGPIGEILSGSPGTGYGRQRQFTDCADSRHSRAKGLASNGSSLEWLRAGAVGHEQTLVRLVVSGHTVHLAHRPLKLGQAETTGPNCSPYGTRPFTCGLGLAESVVWCFNTSAVRLREAR